MASCAGLTVTGTARLAALAIESLMPDGITALLCGVKSARRTGGESAMSIWVRQHSKVSAPFSASWQDAHHGG